MNEQKSQRLNVGLKLDFVFFLSLALHSVFRCHCAFEFCSYAKTSVKTNKQRKQKEGKKKTIGKKTQDYHKLFSCSAVSSISAVQLCMTLTKCYCREVARFRSEVFIFIVVELPIAENGVSVTTG